MKMFLHLGQEVNLVVDAVEGEEVELEEAQPAHESVEGSREVE